eukprot:TRINITY_DN5413_c0_g1_i1.p1 TRINITY_DN5413_c0_g1~~TRINITY_DN5413_c0_g1_i1.p1  ORF type:complete len:590 (-),score=86.94 TRINITY_DN5413_c0_g1_i1:127-1896(-)
MAGTTPPPAHAKDVTCPFCVSLFTDPVTLPCGHNMCSGCIDQLNALRCSTENYFATLDKITGARRQKEQLKCPVCNTPITTPVAQLSHNTMIAKTTEQVRSDLSLLQSPVCWECETSGRNTTATLFCMNCTAPYCQDCSNKKHTGKYFAKHTLKTLSDAKKSLIFLDLCTVHDKVKDVFCKEDNQLCCPYCTTLSGDPHKSHTIITAHDAAQELRTLLTTSTAKIPLTAPRETALAIGKTLKEISAECEKVTGELETSLKEVKIAVDNVLQKARDAVSEEGAQKAEVLVAQQALTKIVSERAQAVVNAVSVATSDFDDLQLIATYGMITSTLNECQSTIKLLDTQPAVAPEISVSYDKASVQTFIKSLEQVKVAIVRPCSMHVQNFNIVHVSKQDQYCPSQDDVQAMVPNASLTTISSISPKCFSKADAILCSVWESIDQAAFGNELAMAVDCGVNVVMICFCNSQQYTGYPTGRFQSENYYPLLPTTGDLDSSSATLGKILIPDHPLMTGVNAITPGSDGRRSLLKTTPGTGMVDIVALWSDGAYLAAVRNDKCGIIVTLSVNCGSERGAKGDAHRLVSNALRLKKHL